MYNLEEFKAWLEEKPERKENLPEWYKINSEKNLENLIKRIHLVAVSPRFDIAGWDPYRAVVNKWLAERERERERARRN